MSSINTIINNSEAVIDQPIAKNNLPLDCIKIICDFVKNDWECRDSLMLVSKDINAYVEVKCDWLVKFKMQCLVQEKLNIKLETTLKYESLIEKEMTEIISYWPRSIRNFGAMGDEDPNYVNRGFLSKSERTTFLGYKFKLKGDKKNIEEVYGFSISSNRPQIDFNLELSTKISDLGVLIKLDHRTFEHKDEGFFVTRYKKTFSDAEDYLLSKADGVLRKHWRK